jgi:hypothetical protein
MPYHHVRDPLHHLVDAVVIDLGVMAVGAI